MVTARLLPQGGGRGLKRSGGLDLRSSPGSPPQPISGRRGAATSWWEGRAVCGARWPECPAPAARGSRRPRPAQAWRPGSRLREGLPRPSVAAPRSAMSKPPPKPVKPGKNSARRACGPPGCETQRSSSRGAPTGSLRTAVPGIRAMRWQHLGRGHFLIVRRVAVKLEFLTGRRTGSALRLGGVCARQLRGPHRSGPGTPGSFGKQHPRCQRGGLGCDPLGS